MTFSFGSSATIY